MGGGGFQVWTNNKYRGSLGWGSVYPNVDRGAGGAWGLSAVRGDEVNKYPNHRGRRGRLGLREQRSCEKGARGGKRGSRESGTGSSARFPRARVMPDVATGMARPLESGASCAGCVVCEPLRVRVRRG